MQLVFPCTQCQSTVRATVTDANNVVSCPVCHSERTLRTDVVAAGQPHACVLCGCEDLWRQKDFPPQIGLTIVGIGALASIIAWSQFWPKTALGILMGFALLDFVLYAVMKDVLVCYRCGARHRHTNPGEDHPKFNLEVSERYRQEQMRLNESEKHAS